MQTATIRLETLSCPSCVAKIESALRQTKGIAEAKVLFHACKVKATFDENATNTERIANVLARLGYRTLGGYNNGPQK
ncbi:MAG TPA: heavy-metal-associated domain-containing protein [Bacilli bacterium]